MAFITNITTADPVTGSFLNGKPSGVDNDMGSVRGFLGSRTATESGLWGGLDFGEGNPVITIVSGAAGATPTKGITAGDFNAGNAQVLERVTTTIAGLSNTVLVGGDSNSANVAFTPLQLASQREYFYKTAVINGQWNIFSGAFSPAATSAYEGVWNIAASVDNAATVRSSGTDYAANTSSTVPGRLTYLQGNPTPVNATYATRYLW